jgi:D-3-phosphoglycerate dehydrogenase
MRSILVTPRSLTGVHHPAVEGLRKDGFDVVYSIAGKLPSEAELLQLVPNIVGWLAGIEPVSPRVIAAARSLQVISRNGTGIDNLPLSDIKERGIRLRTADGANSTGVAELTIALMLASLRHIPFCDAGIKNGQWPRRPGREIRGRVVGVVGCGAVGAQVAQLAAALGASVIAHDPVRSTLETRGGQIQFADLDTVFRGSEIVTLHCPASSDGRPLVDRNTLASFQSGAILINTARASLVDETALVEALDGGHLSTYATDVFAEEPPRASALVQHSRVIATSHIGGFTEESIDRATRIAVANLAESLSTLG